MFKHLLITLDGSPASEVVIGHAIDIARAMRAEVTLLRIVDAVNADWSERGTMGKGQAESTLRSAFSDQAQDYLNRVAQQVKARGVSVTTVVKQGHPGKQIVATAKEVEADGIAMATHSRRGFNKLMFGSVAEEVLHQSNLPVLLVRSAEPER